MPPDHRIRLNEYEVTPPPAWPQSAQPDPQDPVALLDPKPRLASECHIELMAEGEILEHQVAPATKRHQHGEHHEKKPSAHPTEYQRVQRLLGRSPSSDLVVPPYIFLLLPKGPTRAMTLWYSYVVSPYACQ